MRSLSRPGLRLFLTAGLLFAAFCSANLVREHYAALSPWLVPAVLAGCGLAVAAVWTVRRRGGSAVARVEKSGGPKQPPTVAVVVPVLNEAHVLEKSIGTLLQYLREDFPYPAYVVIA